MKRLVCLVWCCFCGIALAQNEKWSEYSQMKEEVVGLLVLANNPGINASQWAWVPQTGSDSDVSWGDPANWPPNYSEKFVIQSTPTKKWIRVPSYQVNDWSFPNTPQTVTVIMTKELYVDAVGNVYDITNELGGDSQHYALEDIPSSKYTLKAWGDMYLDGLYHHSFYHEQEWSPPVAAYNPVFEGGSSVLSIRQQEKWWASDMGWVLGKGPMENGEPSGESGGFYGREQWIAKGIGMGWHIVEYGENPDGTIYYSWEAYLSSTWNWN